jgi:ABC-type dipeptide/oligopeptide/nickel transport system ATPase component
VAKKVAAELGNEFQSKLLAEWKQTNAKTYTHAAARYALTDDMFREQPPTVVVFFKMDFDYNRRTFVPSEPPKPIRIIDLPEPLRVGVLNAIQSSADALKRSKDPEMRRGCKNHVTIIMQGMTTSLTPVNMIGMDTQSYTWDQIMSLFESVHLESKRFRTWQAPQLMNLKAQLNALADTNTSTWTAFLHHSFRSYTKKPLYKTHALLINFTFGRELGQVKAITSYELISLPDARRRLAESHGHDAEQARYTLENVLDVDNSPLLLQSRVSHPKNILLPVIFFTRSHDLDSVFAMFQPFFTELLEHSNISLAASDQQAQNFFRLLQAVSFPSVSSPPLN